MKRLICLMLSCLLAAGVIFIPASAASGIGALEYQKAGDHVAITGYTDAIGSELIIPDKIEGLPVTIIESGAFTNCTVLERVHLPETLQRIDSWAFSGTGLKGAVDIPASVTEIREGAFHGTELMCVRVHGKLYASRNWLTDMPNAPVMVVSKREHGLVQLAGECVRAYEDEFEMDTTSYTQTMHSSGRYLLTDHCAYLLRGVDEPTVSIPQTVEGRTVCGIMDDAFFRATKLKNIHLPEDLLFIRQSTFQHSGLTEVFLPATLNHIGVQAFYGCYDLKRIAVMNPGCTIDDPDGTSKSLGEPDVTQVFGYSGSTAEKYAKQNGYVFKALSEKAGFADVPAKAFYTDAVVWAVENKITNGTSPITFSPDDTCTRGQVVTFLWRASGAPAPASAQTVFTDVGEKAFYAKAVAWAVENQITSGTSKTTFSPDAGCTRGQVVTFLWRAAGSPEPKAKQNPFDDVKANAFYYKAVLWAVEQEITNGMSPTAFMPNDTCTRGQIVTFLYRAMRESQQQEIVS